MATNISSDNDDKHLEIFSLIWLVSNVKETRDTEQKLRSIINRLKKFHDIKQCQQYIEQTSEKDRLVLIVSGQLGREIVPLIHHIRQVISIYVYCMDKKANEQWACQFGKVKDVIIDVNELIARLTEDHKVQKKVEEPLSINIFSTNDGGKSTTGLNGQFIFSQILMDCLLRLKSTEIDKDELINLYQNEYEGNPYELDHIREFQEEYSSDKVLWWYTRESFFYRTLNAALRTQNIHMIFLLRTFISDMEQQLKKYQSNEILRVYRGQIISNEELDHLKQSIGQFISINSFFSTSKHRTLATFILGEAIFLVDWERVLFEIDADPKMFMTKPFADVSEHSDFPDEVEVLFMTGSIFRLENIFCNDDQIWIIQMTLCSDDEHDLKQILIHMKRQIENEDTSLRTLGKILWKMGKLDLAEKYFKRLLGQLPSDDPLIYNLYEDLTELASQAGDYDTSIQWRQKLIEFEEQTQLSDKFTRNKTKGSVDRVSQKIETDDKETSNPRNIAQTEVIIPVSGNDPEPYNKNNWQIRKKKCNKCSKAVIIALTLLTVFPVVTFIMGLTYTNDCPIETRLPLWLTVFGAVGLITFSILIFIACITILYCSGTNNVGRKIGIAILCSLVLFYFAWLIVGVVWTTSIDVRVRYNETNRENYCSKVFYNFTSETVAALWAIIALIIMFACFVGFCVVLSKIKDKCCSDLHLLQMRS